MATAPEISVRARRTGPLPALLGSGRLADLRGFGLMLAALALARLAAVFAPTRRFALTASGRQQ